MKTLPALTVLALVGLALAGCSAGTPSGPSSGPSNAGGSGGTSGSSSASTAGKSSEVDVCAVVPLAKIGSLTGRSGYLKTNGGATTKSGVDVDVCQYFDVDDASTKYQLTLAVYRNADPSKIFADRAAMFGSLAPISGYGDRAQGSDGALDVAYGSNVITVTDALHPNSESSLTTAQLAKIVDALHAKL
jgi:hypothetical protein